MPPRFFRPTTSSTQDEAIALARDGAEDGTLVVAGSQERGRGREARSWVSPPGGLYLSMILRPPPAASGLLPIAIGTSLARSLETAFGLEVRVKWPNDLLLVRPGLPAQKLAGILVDRVEAPAGGPALVVGIGLNLDPRREEFTGALRERVAILTDAVRRAVEPALAEGLVVDAVRAAARSLSDPAGRAAVLSECRARLYGVGRPALLDGEPVGTVREIGDDGALWLDRGGERVAVRTGTLTVEEAG